jgi:hypothetical protein
MSPMSRAFARSAAALALLVFSVLALVPSAAQGAQRPVLFSTQCANAHYKPTKIVITCADADAIFYAETWTRWDATGARATGDFVHSDCPPRVPLVACHHDARDAASVYLYRVRFCPKKGRRYFTRLRLTDHDTTNPYLRTIRLKYPCGYVQ